MTTTKRSTDPRFTGTPGGWQQSPRRLVSVQPQWALELPLQQQSVMLLATRGPDGVGKTHPSKRLHVCYRASVLVAAKYGRELRWGEIADGFMSLFDMADEARWNLVVNSYFDHVDSLPHHYAMHLMHGAQIVGYKHPDVRVRSKWCDFYLRSVVDLHLSPESPLEMDRRLDDWAHEHWEGVP